MYRKKDKKIILIQLHGGDLKKGDCNPYGRITKSTYAIEYKLFSAFSLLVNTQKSS